MELRLSDAEWDLIRPHLSRIPQKKSWHGRPRASDRRIFEALLWLLMTGARWVDLPKDYPAKSSVHRRFQTWSRDGSFLKLHRGLVRTLNKQHKLDFSEGFIDTSFIKAKKGGPWLLSPLEERGRKSLH